MTHTESVPLYVFSLELRSFQLWRVVDETETRYLYLGEKPGLNSFSGLDEETVAIEHSVFGKSDAESFDESEVTNSNTYFWVFANSVFSLLKDDWRVQTEQKI